MKDDNKLSYDVPFGNLREWIAEAEKLGELRRVDGASWEKDIGLATELLQHDENAPCALFDDIPGYPKGYRILTNFFGGTRQNMTLGFATDLTKVELSNAFLERYRDAIANPIPYRVVDDGPVLENVLNGDDVNVLKFPTPKWHDGDGGRYIGTGSFNVTKDPESDWINVGTYRVMVHDEKTVGFYISPGKHGRLHRQKYTADDQPMPVCVVVGVDPLTFLMSSTEVPHGVCEFDVAGALRGKPLDVVIGKHTGLPFPAEAEIVLEGFCHPGKTRLEGPFGEWTGFYGSPVHEGPINRMFDQEIFEMKAAVIHEFGDFDVLKVEDVRTPKPRHGHVLVKVLAAGINRLDDYIRGGSIVPELAFPHILGADAAGEVFELGIGVAGLAVGERVIVVPGYATEDADADIRPTVTAPSFALPGLHIWGTYAQYIEVPARAVVKDETGLGAEEVATLPVVLATAVHAVKGVGDVKAGDKVLVHAGASGSGSMLIQVAKALGAEVATTVRDDAKGEFAKRAGADLVIDARADEVVERVMEWTGGRGADVAIDNLGGDVLAKSIEAVKAEGVVVAFGFAAGPEVSFDIRNLFFSQKQLKGTMASDIEDLKWGLERVKAGTIKPLLDRALPLRDAAEAHRLIANSEVKGNIVLLPWAA